MAQHSRITDKNTAMRFAEMTNKNMTMISGWMHDSTTLVPKVGGDVVMTNNNPTMVYCLGLKDSCSWRTDYSNMGNFWPSLIDTSKLGCNVYTDSRGYTYILNATQAGVSPNADVSIFDAQMNLVAKTSTIWSSGAEMVVLSEHPTNGIYVYHDHIDVASSATSSILYISSSGSVVTLNLDVGHAGGLAVLHDDGNKFIVAIYSPFVSSGSNSYTTGTSSTSVVTITKAPSPSTGNIAYSVPPVTKPFGNFHSMMSKPFKASSTSLYTFFCNGQSATSNKLYYTSFDLQTSAGTSYGTVSTDANPLDGPWTGMTTTAGYGRMLMINVKNKYLVAIPSRRKYDPSWSNNDHSFAQIWEWNSSTPTSLNYLRSNDFTNTKIVGFVPVNDDNTVIVICGENACGIYRWDDDLGYVLMQEIPNVIYAVGVDSIGRIWYQTSTHMNVISNTMSGDIRISLQSSNYAYAGSNINTNLLVDAYDHLGNKIEQDIVLTLNSGPALFSNGTKTARVKTSIAETSQVMMTITGPGRFEVTSQAII